MATEKFSATVDEDVLEAVRDAAGERGLSAFVDRALRNELRRVQLRELLDELRAEVGPADEETKVEVRQLLDDLENRQRRLAS